MEQLVPSTPSPLLPENGAHLVAQLARASARKPLNQESGKGDAHRLALTEAQALGVSEEAVQAWLPELQAWLLLKPVHPGLDAPTAEAAETT